ncbi:replication-relaxation family protein [Bdellovibrio sp. HCB-162]|uniref:replication-relaxation family protein n=1 Tax=Bdellovibrio sp. HCB-162 TaxID=3394234 RepID=UPI0039BD443F
MNELDLGKLIRENGRVKKDRGVILTERDIEVIEFILDMKFSSVEDIFERFFKVTLAGEEARSNEWAIRRLQQLAKAGYLKGTFSFSERTKFYLATPKGYKAVSDAKPEAYVIKPSQVIDHRTFAHDRLVLESRIILENQRAASCWISDKKLRSSRELAGGLVHSNVPDGIFKTESGERVALELELSLKSRSQYITKVRKYVSMMRSENQAVKVFDRVLYVCAKQATIDYLTKETKIYGSLFEVQSFNTFFSRG